jgi:hypothetical protein
MYASLSIICVLYNKLGIKEKDETREDTVIQCGHFIPIRRLLWYNNMGNAAVHQHYWSNHKVQAIENSIL